MPKDYSLNWSSSSDYKRIEYRILLICYFLKYVSGISSTNHTLWCLSSQGYTSHKVRCLSHLIWHTQISQLPINRIDKNLVVCMIRLQSWFELLTRHCFNISLFWTLEKNMFKHFFVHSTSLTRLGRSKTKHISLGDYVSSFHSCCKCWYTAFCISLCILMSIGYFKIECRWRPLFIIIQFIIIVGTS